MWPLSRTGLHKRFLCLTGKESLLKGAILLLANLDNVDALVASPSLITREDHSFLASEKLSEIGVELRCGLLEPVGRNTSPADSLAWWGLKT